jgi:predicted CoA-binding protein
LTLEAGGMPRNYHQLEDVPEALDMESVIRAADFAVAVAVAWLRGEAEPLAIV